MTSQLIDYSAESELQRKADEILAEREAMLNRVFPNGERFVINVTKDEAREQLENAKKEKAKQRKTRRQKRIELEKRFIGCVIARADYDGDIREMVSEFGITWRHFIDRRHRVMWRALEALNLRSVDERLDILTQEAYAAVNQDPRTVDSYEDLVRGVPGSIAAAEFYAKIDTASRGLPWLERELEAAGALRLIGGKVYLREIAEIGQGELSARVLAEEMLR